jgi:hypothetical protein
MTMKTLNTVLEYFVRVDAVILIVLGLLFWTGNADALIPIHMLLGIALVIALWALAALAAAASVSLGLVVLAFVWGLVVPVLGLRQTTLLVGSAHWIIQVLHLLVGLTAIALAQVLAQRTRRNLTTSSPAHAQATR